jgi:sulfur carrier protein ThiS
MIIEMSSVFLYGSNLNSKMNFNLTDKISIQELIEILSVRNTDYAMFFINDKIAKKNDIVCNDDKLTILPIVDGG